MSSTYPYAAKTKSPDKSLPAETVAGETGTPCETWLTLVVVMNSCEQQLLPSLPLPALGSDSYLLLERRPGASKTLRK